MRMLRRVSLPVGLILNPSRTPDYIGLTVRIFRCWDMTQGFLLVDLNSQLKEKDSSKFPILHYTCAHKCYMGTCILSLGIARATEECSLLSLESFSLFLFAANLHHYG